MTYPTRRHGRLLASLLSCTLALAASRTRAEPPGRSPPVPGVARRWSLAAEPVPAEGGLLALATGLAGAAAAGDARGLLWRRAPDARAWLRIALRGAVHDLAFAPDGALWIASDEGLFRLAGERLATHPPAPGDEARAALRVAVRGNVIAVATQGGVHWSLDGQRFARVDGRFGDPEDTSGAAESFSEGRGDDAGEAGEPPVSGITLAPPAAPGGAATLWIAARRGLFRAALASRDGAARVRAEPVDTPAALRPALDVTQIGDEVLALGPDVLLVGPGRWRVQRPELPPGARPARLLATARGLWIATDRGVVEAERPDGPWRRAGEPAGSKPATALALDRGDLLVASSLGLLVGAPFEARAGNAPGAAASPGVRDGCDPPIAAVQRAALVHLDLTGARTARMWRGVRRRGALPDVSLDGALSDDRRHDRNWDEAFSSGEMHRLFDRDRDREREQAIALRLTWELGDLLYHPEEIDVSTEMRRTIELRDDVLDELNQLYFDRRRALAAAAEAGAGTPDAARESLRAEELAAGLDAWTGGWFGPRAGTSPCPDDHP